MRNFFRKPYRWAAVYTSALTLFTVFVLLHAFVIPRAGIPLSSGGADTGTASQSGASSSGGTADSASGTGTGSGGSDTDGSGSGSDAVITDTSYDDGNISITIETVREYDTTFYVADIQLSSADYLKTAFAGGTYGRNIKDTTSDMAADDGAIFAINGDYYGFRDDGFVLRNGVLYRATARDTGNDDALVVDKDGNFSIVSESETDAQALADSGAWQILSFGPALIDDGEVAVNIDSEVGQARNSNPRTAIGQVSELHYIVIVSDGRTDESAGLSLLELADEFQERGCTVAYNLDGGGSSTMWFNGRVVNNPTDGRTDSERKVSDIVYIGY